MEEFVIKKKIYKVVEEYHEHCFKVENDNKFFIVRSLGTKSVAFYNFCYANKRLVAAGVSIPKILVKDKKQGLILEEFIDGDTVYDMLRNKDLDEKIYELVFVENWRARVNGLRLNFNPLNFRYVNGRLIYTAFVFDVYKKDEDFSQKEIRLWFYTKEFKANLIENGLDIEFVAKNTGLSVDELNNLIK